MLKSASPLTPALFVVLALLAWPTPAPAQTASTTTSAATTASREGIIPAAELKELLPATVFFKGQIAPLQIRNASAIRLKGGSIIFASLVDTGGYATGTREQYQLYLVAESRIHIGSKVLEPGAYGCGVLADGSFLIMDIGGHKLMSFPTTVDSSMKRPRPLQIVAQNNSYRLYLGRHYIDFAVN